MVYDKYFTHNIELNDFLEDKDHLKIPSYLFIGKKVRIINDPLIGAQKAVEIFNHNEDRDSRIDDFWGTGQKDFMKLNLNGTYEIIQKFIYNDKGLWWSQIENDNGRAYWFVDTTLERISPSYKPRRIIREFKDFKKLT